MKRALVTGSAGFVGRHFHERLAADGWTVHGVDLFASATSAAWDVRRLFAEPHGLDYDLVVHCAAVVGGRATIEGQPMAVATDLAIDADLWQWALRTRPGRVVYFSSSAAYPTWLQDGKEYGRVPPGDDLVDMIISRRLHEWDIALDHIQHPDQTYGLAKLVGEIQAAHVRNEGIPVTVVRPFSGYGTDQDLDYPFPSFIQRAAERADPFDIWGDGQQVRDWIHIDDIVTTVMVMVDQGIDGPVNLCTGRPTNFDELAEIVCAKAGYQPELRHLTDAPAGVRYRVGDPTLMRSFYTPKIPLEEGVARALTDRRRRMAA